MIPSYEASVFANHPQINRAFAIYICEYSNVRYITRQAI